MRLNTSRLFSSLREVLSSKIEIQREVLSNLSNHLQQPIDDIKVDAAIDGMKGVKVMLCETSKVKIDGIKFRGYSIQEVINELPGSQKQPSLESMFWLLLTGEIPTYSEFKSLSSELSSNAFLPKSTEDLLCSLPKEMHPMTQLSIAVLSLSQYSKFSNSLTSTAHTDLWKLMLEDCLFLLAKLPRIAGMIYRNTFRDSKTCEPGDYDLAENYGRMLGWRDEEFFEALRLLLLIHCDHEGGNVSTHATRLVGSSHSNVFQAYSAGINGLAGPTHGLGMQFALMWLIEMWKTLGENINEQTVEIYAKNYLLKHEKIPGFGHPVLVNTDTRFLAQLEFADKHLKNDELCKIIKMSYKVVPDILKHHGKKNQYANMYLHSAGTLYHFGLRMYEYYAVIFAVSRAVGAFSNLIWDRALMLKQSEFSSFTLEDLENLK